MASTSVISTATTTKRMAIDTQEMTEATAWRCLALSVRTSWSLSRKSASIRLVIFCADQLMNRAANSEKMMIRVIFRPLVRIHSPMPPRQKSCQRCAADKG